MDLRYVLGKLAVGALWIFYAVLVAVAMLLFIDHFKRAVLCLIAAAVIFALSWRILTEPNGTRHF